MASNKIQFQKSISFHEFIEKFGTEEKCEQMLFKARWPNGFTCERCGNDSYCYIKSRHTFQCNRCKHQTSVKSNTLFHSSNVPLTKWFLAIYLLSQNKNGQSALGLKRHLGVKYETAWRMKHKLMQAMAEKDTKRRLSGLITIDDAYLGGKKNGKRGRGSENKQPFIAAVSLDVEGHPRHVKFTPVKSFSESHIGIWVRHHLYPSSVVASDGFAGFNIISKINEHKHFSIPMKRDPKTGEIPYFQWVNTILGNVKSAMKGTYRSNGKEYSERYLAEFQFRINRRFDLRSLFIGLIYTAVFTPPLPGEILKLAANYG